MHDGTPINHHRLPSELVALIHHVELSEAGWRDRLLDQLVTAVMFLRATPCESEELRTSLGLAAQRVEARIGCKILNTMTALGMPDSEMIG